jgi:hypothetical protein
MIKGRKKKNPSQKKAIGVTQGVGPEFKPSAATKETGQVWWHLLVIPAVQEAIYRRVNLRTILGKRWDPIWKITKRKKARGKDGLRGTASALEAQGLEFKLYY